MVSGKGGVGKTTVAAALSALAARSGRSVLLVSSDGRADAARLFGKEDAGYVEAELAPGLRTLTAAFDDLLADFVYTVAPFRFVGDRILASSTFRYFTRATPGLPDLLLLGKARELFRRKKSTKAAPRYDLLVLDAPATGHARSLLSLPRTLLRTTPAGPLRKVGNDVDRILADPAAAALVVVAEPAEFAAREAEELSDSAKRDAGLSTMLVVVNRIGRSGRPETLPATALPILRIPEIETFEEARSPKGDDGATAFFEDVPLHLGRKSLGAEPLRCRRGDPLPIGTGNGRSLGPRSRVPTARAHALADRSSPPRPDRPRGGREDDACRGGGARRRRRGRRALVLTVDPARRLAQALGLPEGGRKRAEPVEVPASGLPRGGSLHALQIDPKATFESLLARFAPPAAVKRIRENRLYAGLVDSLPGVLEYMGVEALYEHSQNGGLRTDRPRHSPRVTRPRLPRRPRPDGGVALERRPPLVPPGGLASLARSLGASRGAAAVLRLADSALGFGFLSDLADFFRAFDGLYGGFRDPEPGDLRPPFEGALPRRLVARRLLARRRRRNRGGARPEKG